MGVTRGHEHVDFRRRYLTSLIWKGSAFHDLSSLLVTARVLLMVTVQSKSYGVGLEQCAPTAWLP